MELAYRRKINGVGGELTVLAVELVVHLPLATFVLALLIVDKSVTLNIYESVLSTVASDAKEKYDCECGKY